MNLTKTEREVVEEFLFLVYRKRICVVCNCTFNYVGSIGKQAAFYSVCRLHTGMSVENNMSSVTCTHCIHKRTSHNILRYTNQQNTFPDTTCGCVKIVHIDNTIPLKRRNYNLLMNAKPVLLRDQTIDRKPTPLEMTKNRTNPQKLASVVYIRPTKLNEFCSIENGVVILPLFILKHIKDRQIFSHQSTEANMNRTGNYLELFTSFCSVENMVSTFTPNELQEIENYFSFSGDGTNNDILIIDTPQKFLSYFDVIDKYFVNKKARKLNKQTGTNNNIRHMNFAGYGQTKNRSKRNNNGYICLNTSYLEYEIDLLYAYRSMCELHMDIHISIEDFNRYLTRNCHKLANGFIIQNIQPTTQPSQPSSTFLAQSLSQVKKRTVKEPINSQSAIKRRAISKPLQHILDTDDEENIEEEGNINNQDIPIASKDKSQSVSNSIEEIEASAIPSNRDITHISLSSLTSPSESLDESSSNSTFLSPTKKRKSAGDSERFLKKIKRTKIRAAEESEESRDYRPKDRYNSYKPKDKFSSMVPDSDEIDVGAIENKFFSIYGDPILNPSSFTQKSVVFPSSFITRMTKIKEDQLMNSGVNEFEDGMNITADGITEPLVFPPNVAKIEDRLPTQARSRILLTDNEEASNRGHVESIRMLPYNLEMDLKQLTRKIESIMSNINLSTKSLMELETMEQNTIFKEWSFLQSDGFVPFVILINAKQESAEI